MVANCTEKILSEEEIDVETTLLLKTLIFSQLVQFLFLVFVHGSSERSDVSVNFSWSHLFRGGGYFWRIGRWGFWSGVCSGWGSFFAVISLMSRFVTLETQSFPHVFLLLFYGEGIDVHGIGVFFLEVPSSLWFIFFLLSFVILSFVWIGSADDPLDVTIFVIEFDCCFIPFFQGGRGLF